MTNSMTPQPSTPTHSDTELRAALEDLTMDFSRNPGKEVVDVAYDRIRQLQIKAKIDQLCRCSDLQYITKRADRIEWVNRELATLQSQETQQ